jgi:hypothetical protein
LTSLRPGAPALLEQRQGSLPNEQRRTDVERINFTSAKGGQGTSVTACAVALAAAGRGLRVGLDGEDRDALEAILGMGGGGAVLPGLVLGDADGHEVDLFVYDGTDEEGTTLLVTRGCYLALRRAVRQTTRPAGVVLVEEPGRALGANEVAEVIGAPIVARVPVRPAIARAVDAGVLAARLPAALDLAAGTILDFAAATVPG